MFELAISGFFLFVGLIILVVIAGMIMQMTLFYKIFSVVTNRIQQQIAANAPRNCSFCQGKIEPGQTNCPSCGGQNG